jgi:uncharacterized Zn finger protein
MNFTVKCDKCGSEDVLVEPFLLDDLEQMEVWATCKECGNVDEISG